MPYPHQVCQCGHMKTTHVMMKKNCGTVIHEGPRGTSVHEVKMKRILQAKRPTTVKMAETTRLKNSAKIERTEAAIEGPNGEVRLGCGSMWWWSQHRHQR